MHNEDILTAGLREVEEELGLRFCETDLVYTGIYRINNEHPLLLTVKCVICTFILSQNHFLCTWR